MNCTKKENDGRVPWQKAAKDQSRVEHNSVLSFRMNQYPLKTLIKSVDLLNNFSNSSPNKYM